ncbi:hypothetical protein ACEZDB_28295 [Streptacidiphilus sp. N1-3]|uniref:Uncharacterized protein n=1 Tax=Streptacidiphilus alkalitolerans TaxID=3342712 RepID=A0ABV6X8C9_9ACTN
MILGTVFVTLEFLVDGTVDVFAGRIGDWFGRRQAARRRLDVATGQPEVVRMLVGATTVARRAWVQGLARNASAPASVLLRILALDPLPVQDEWLTERRLPMDVATAAVRHPDARARSAVLQNRSPPTAPRVRRACVVLAGEYGVELPDDALQALVADDNAKIRYWTTAIPGLSSALRRRLADDLAHLRAVGPAHALGAGALPSRSPSPSPDHRGGAAGLRWGDAASVHGPRRRRAAAGAAVDQALAELLVAEPDPRIRAAAAGNRHVATAAALTLVHDPDEEVRLQLSLREDIDEEQRSTMSWTVPQGRREPVSWVSERHPDAAAMRSAASSLSC